MLDGYVPPCEKGKDCVLKFGPVSWHPRDGSKGAGCKYNLIGFPKPGYFEKCLWCFKYGNLPDTHMRDLPDDLKNCRF